MTRTPTISAEQVQREYNRVKVLLPNIGELTQNNYWVRGWHIGRTFIGRNNREAERFLTGVVAGLRYAAFKSERAS